MENNPTKINQKGFEVRDMRHKEKFHVDDLYLNGYAKKCGIYATGVYFSLCRHADKEQKCWPSIRKMAEELDVSTKQVGRAIKILEVQNIIKKIRVGKKLNNRYLLLDKSEWTDSPITKDYQSNHMGTTSPFHSKDTQLRNTQKKENLLLEDRIKILEAYKRNDPKTRGFYKPRFLGDEMRFSRGKWWVIPKNGGEWLLFVGKDRQIELE